MHIPSSTATIQSFPSVVPPGGGAAVSAPSPVAIAPPPIQLSPEVSALMSQLMIEAGIGSRAAGASSTASSINTTSSFSPSVSAVPSGGLYTGLPANLRTTLQANLISSGLYDSLHSGHQPSLNLLQLGAGLQQASLNTSGHLSGLQHQLGASVANQHQQQQASLQASLNAGLAGAGLNAGFARVGLNANLAGAGLNAGLSGSGLVGTSVGSLLTSQQREYLMSQIVGSTALPALGATGSFYPQYSLAQPSYSSLSYSGLALPNYSNGNTGYTNYLQSGLGLNGGVYSAGQMPSAYNPLTMAPTPQQLGVFGLPSPLSGPGLLQHLGVFGAGDQLAGSSMPTQHLGAFGTTNPENLSYSMSLLGLHNLNLLSQRLSAQSTPPNRQT